MDIYTICDYKETTLYWGLNREDEFYEKFNHLPPHKREKKRPTPEEFWSLTEPKTLKIFCNEHADWRKFKTWLKKTVYESEKKEISYDEEARRKFDSEIDVCLGEYDQVGKVHRDIAIFKWDYSYFMNKEDLKKLKEKPEKIKPPMAFDFS